MSCIAEIADNQSTIMQRYARTVGHIRIKIQMWKIMVESAGTFGMLYPCCGTGPVPGLEGYQAQNSKGSWNWCTGVGDSGYPVLFACFCGSPHLWLVELGYAGLAVSLAADYFRLSLPERPFVFLSWETVSNLRPMYR